LVVKNAKPTYKKTQLPPEQWKLTQELVKTLKEDKSSVWLFMNIVDRCGVEKTRELFQQTLEIEENGGIMLTDGSRRRTPGGVFFHLVKETVSDEERKAIFYQPKSLKAAPVPEVDIPEVQPITIPDNLPAEIKKKVEELRTAHEQYRTRLNDLRTRPINQQFGLTMTQKLLTAVEKQIDDLLQVQR